MQKEKLKIREWTLCLIVCSSVAFLFASSSSYEKRTAVSPLEKKGEGGMVLVKVEGAVINPGEYEVSVGASLKKVLAEAGVASAADRRSVYSKKIILNSCEVFVPNKTTSSSAYKRQAEINNNIARRKNECI